jgi:hypothetical protein
MKMKNRKIVATGCALLCAFLLVAGKDPENVRPVRLNPVALSYAKDLISEGHVVLNRKGAWAKDRPSPEIENDFIRQHGFNEYAKWHLGIDDRYPENTKRRYKFPYGDFKNVHRCALLAAKARARQYRYGEIEKAAAELERAIKGDRRISNDFQSGRLEHRLLGLCAQRSCTLLESEQRVSNPLAAQAGSLCSDPICVDLAR